MGNFGQVRPDKDRFLRIIYNIFCQDGTFYEAISISGRTYEECQESLDAYLNTKQDVYAESVDEEV